MTVKPNYRERASVLCLHKDRALLVTLQDPVSLEQRLFFPGGKIEAGETSAEAAIRETLEETGYQIKLRNKPSFVQTYKFFWAGALVDCKTHWFCAGLQSEESRPVHDADYHKGVHWIPIDEVFAKISFHKEIAEAYQHLLDC